MDIFRFRRDAKLFNLIKTKYVWEETWSPVKKVFVQNWIKSEMRACKSAPKVS